jgi:hypothetical protein
MAMENPFNSMDDFPITTSMYRAFAIDKFDNTGGCFQSPGSKSPFLEDLECLECHNELFPREAFFVAPGVGFFSK